MGNQLRKALLTTLLVPLLALGPAASASDPVTDPTGDTKDADGNPVASGPADIVTAQAEASGDDLAFRYRAAQPLDPLTDPGWTSDDSYADFMIDTNGDGEADYDAEYGVDEGALYVVVTVVDGDDELCEGKATYESPHYRAFVPKSCIGNPTAFSYLVETSYDADPSNATSPVAYDTAPEGGLVAG